MILYRIANCKYINSLDGIGARQFGARWNSKGNAVVYLASSRALSVLEVLVHLQPLFTPNGFCVADIEVPDDKILTLDIKSLPANWKELDSSPELKKIGDDFLKNGEYLMLKVPSAIVEQEHNYMLNPSHPDTTKVKIINKRPFNFDERLL
ncbi:RES family NAD+ phosphorylase [Mucilaginibacter psychrotolerans]|uniref:RES domain-containing protein n=1 Tax=Mucilaginibacter psychrotolerans TaxID=1524096 RepID=A0A4Y8S8K5_9SPHI|nr:RES family NAD+ phosphorylase [Mucilaginibacter psychrotolerans]TFF34981.1 RES domain-containing protein [Mucilaginibacter psychrotolerans]